MKTDIDDNNDADDDGDDAATMMLWLFWSTHFESVNFVILSFHKNIKLVDCIYTKHH